MWRAFIYNAATFFIGYCLSCFHYGHFYCCARVKYERNVTRKGKRTLQACHRVLPLPFYYRHNENDNALESYCGHKKFLLIIYIPLNPHIFYEDIIFFFLHKQLHDLGPFSRFHFFQEQLQITKGPYKYTPNTLDLSRTCLYSFLSNLANYFNTVPTTKKHALLSSNQ